MAVCEECYTIDTAESAPAVPTAPTGPTTGCTSAFDQLCLKPSKVILPALRKGTTRQPRAQPKLTGPVRHLGPTGKKFLERELLRKALKHRKEPVAEYQVRPDLLQSRCWAEQDRQKQAHRQAVRTAIIADLRSKQQIPGPIGQLSNGIPWPCYDPAEFKIAYHHRAHRPQYRRSSEASAEGSNTFSLPRSGASIGSEYSWI